jgi:hypothetical protein
MRMWMLMAATVGMAAQEPEKKLPPPLEQRKFEALDRALRQSWQAKAPAPLSRPCAIPLLHVKPPAVNPDPMMLVAPKGPMAGKDQVKVPAPACDEVKK